MQIKILHKQGKSLRAITCEAGCSVSTARKYLSDQAQPAYSKRAHRASMLEPCIDNLRERVAAAAPD